MSDNDDHKSPENQAPDAGSQSADSSNNNANESSVNESSAQTQNKGDAWTQADETKVPKIEAVKEDENWQREVISKLAFSALVEQRRSRRWSIAFRVAILVYLFLLFIYIPGDLDGGGKVAKKGGKHAALVELKGVIADNTDANAVTVMSGLKAAFEDKNTSGVILEINSPGGSPVQSGYINDEIGRLREKYPDIPLYAVITDTCASGGYYVAAAADEIYADKASIVGSIGVLMDGFGFTEAMQKLGVERRLMTAGEHKGFLDPFSPAQREDVMHVKNLLSNIHKQFIDTVKQGRGSRLKENPDLFSGLVWTGEQSIELGLVDGIGSSGFVAREIIGVESIVDFTRRPNFVNRIVDRLGVAMGDTLSTALGLGGANLR